MISCFLFLSFIQSINMQSEKNNEDDKNKQLKDQYFHEKKKLFEEGCLNNKDPLACFSLGEWYQLINKDNLKAAELYDLNCFERNHSNSCFNLATLYLNQGSVYSSTNPLAKGDETKKKAIADFKSISNELNSITPLRSKAKYLAKRACLDLLPAKDGCVDPSCQNNNIQACTSYATLLLGDISSAVKNPSLSNDEKSLESMRKEAISILDNMCMNERESGSCARLGTIYVNGKAFGIEKDVSKALKYAERACEMGHPHGCHTLSVMYKLGDGVQQDMRKFEAYKEKTMKILKEAGAGTVINFKT